MAEWVRAQLHPCEWPCLQFGATPLFKKRCSRWPLSTYLCGLTKCRLLLVSDSHLTFLFFVVSFSPQSRPSVHECPEEWCVPQDFLSISAGEGFWNLYPLQVSRHHGVHVGVLDFISFSQTPNPPVMLLLSQSNQTIVLSLHRTGMQFETGKAYTGLVFVTCNLGIWLTIWLLITWEYKGGLGPFDLWTLPFCRVLWWYAVSCSIGCKDFLERGYWVSFCLIPLRQDLSINLEFVFLARLAVSKSQWSFCLYPVSAGVIDTHGTMPGLLYVCALELWSSRLQSKASYQMRQTSRLKKKKNNMEELVIKLRNKRVMEIWAVTERPSRVLTREGHFLLCIKSFPMRSVHF